MAKRFIYLLCCFVICEICQLHFAHSQKVTGKPYYNIGFSKVPGIDFLQFGTIESIVQDNKGFMWFGTKDGLARYDGFNIKIYHQKPNDKNSISYNIITFLFKDSKGTLWVGTPDGLNRYNYDQDNFTVFQRTSGAKGQISNNFINHIAEDAQGNIWVATYYGGISIYNPLRNEFTYLLHQKEDYNCIATNDLRCILFDSQHRVWIGTRNAGADVLNLKNNTWQHFKNQPNDRNSLPYNEIRSIFEDSFGNIWLGSHGGGLARYNSATQNFKVYKHEPGNTSSIPSDVIWSIFEDSNKNLFFCTQDGGIALYLRQSDTFYNYQYSLSNPSSIGCNIVRTIYEDNAKNLWIGLFNAGVNFVDYHKKEFYTLTNNPANPNSLSHNPVFSILKDSKGILWIGTDGGGLSRYDIQTNTFKVLKNSRNNPTTISNDKPTSLVEDRYGNIWAGIYDGGLNCIDPKTLTVKRFFTGRTEKSLIYTVWCLLADSDKIWVGTNMGLYTIDPKTYQIHSFSYNTNNHEGTNNEDVWKIFKDSKNRILIATSLGLNVYTPKNQWFDYYEHHANDSNSISKNWVTSICEDSKHRIWIGTYGGGLNLWQEQVAKFKSFNSEKGLANDAVFGILEDKADNLWLCTNNGIVKFNYEKHTIQNYDVNDGLPGNHFLTYFKDNDGWMYFGGISGLTYFNPQYISANNFVPPIVLTDFKLFNKSVDINAAESPIHENFVTAKHIQLNYKHSLFSISFSSLNYSVPQRNNFRYKLEGFENKWIEAGNEHTVTFTNLNPGEYTFKVQGSNNDNVWNHTGASIKITVTPPFYKSIAFIIISIVLLITLLLSLYFIRIKTIRNQKEKLELMVYDRTTELEERNEEINLQKEELLAQRDLATAQRDKISQQHTELDMHRNNLEGLVLQRTKDLVIAKVKAEESDKLKSAFLANMSHEIRTPMNAVLGFLDLLKDEYFSREEKSQFMEIIENNSQLLLRLIDDIIDLSKIEAGEITVNQTHTSIKNVVAELQNIFATKVKTKTGIEFIVELDIQSNLAIKTDYVRLKQILTNLLDNALKFTDSGYIKLICKMAGGQLFFTVEDTGIGISKANVEKIFDRFFKVEEINTRLFSGTGLGLAISKKLAQLLGGKLWVASEICVGSSFTLALPAIISADAETVNTLSEKGRPNSLHWENKTVLIVEDEDSNFQFLSYLLKTTKIGIHRAFNGLEAVAMVEKNGNLYNLILMDIQMPLMNGYDATTKIKSMASEIPIIAQTAHAMGQERERCLACGCDNYISKPINKNQLLLLLQKYIV